MKPLVVFLQYTNPAGYPPLEHASRVLASQGFDVLFLGAAADGADTLEFPPHASIATRRLPGFGAGLLQRFNYIVYVFWAALICAWRRPRWIYASDILACPAAIVSRAVSGARVVYHEHDAPPADPRSRLQRFLMNVRGKLARSADLVVAPQAVRLEAFIAETGRSKRSLCVWNCPLREEVAQSRRSADNTRPLTFYYHGSLNQERLPLALVDALRRASPDARLTVVGYETIGSKGYMTTFLDRAAELGLSDRIVYLGALPARGDIMARAREADVGLALMPAGSRDLNMIAMAGASNKPFDYMACGLMLLVSDLPDWNAMFVEPGYARSCGALDVEALSAAMAWCDQHRDEVRYMGEAGRRRILEDWNYETTFAEVVDEMRGQLRQ